MEPTDKTIENPATKEALNKATPSPALAEVATTKLASFEHSADGAENSEKNTSQNGAELETTPHAFSKKEEQKLPKRAIKVDYKSPATLYQFISEGGKINPARITGLNHSEQRALRNAIKKARRLSLIPSSTRAYDDFGYPEPISAKPFQIS